jgi:hypothetical protein
MVRRRFLCSLAVLMALTASPRAQSSGDGRDADRAAIRAHIESICQAFIDGDVEKIFATHTQDWRGFLESSRKPIKGIDEYMRANGIPWPLPAGATPQRKAPDPSRTFRLSDFDVHFYSPDIGVANFLLDFGQTSGTTFTTTQRYRIMDIYVRRSGAWNQAASHTVVDPAWRAEQAARTQAPAAASAPPPPSTLAMHAQLVSQYRTVQRLLMRAAELMPEDAYGLRPAADMRPFIRNIAHAASSNYGYCANLQRAERPVPQKGFEESLTTKAAAIKALADSGAYCDGFMKSVTADTLGATYTASARGPDGTTSPLQVAIGGLLSAFVAHQNEVYGYTAVYLRLKGLVPPSSAPPPGSGRGGH